MEEEAKPSVAAGAGRKSVGVKIIASEEAVIMVCLMTASWVKT
jgi:hypothetical protein